MKYDTVVCQSDAHAGCSIHSCIFQVQIVCVCLVTGARCKMQGIGRHPRVAQMPKAELVLTRGPQSAIHHHSLTCEHSPMASTDELQHWPCASTTLPDPLQIPHVSTPAPGQHWPALSMELPSAQQVPCLSRSPDRQHCCLPSTMPLSQDLGACKADTLRFKELLAQQPWGYA